MLSVNTKFSLFNIKFFFYYFFHFLGISFHQIILPIKPEITKKFPKTFVPVNQTGIPIRQPNKNGQSALININTTNPIANTGSHSAQIKKIKKTTIIINTKASIRLTKLES